MIAPPKQSLRILCVEEDPVQRKLLKACLEVMGAEGRVVARPLDAVWAFRRNPVDIVFLDIDLDVANGLTALEAIRSTPLRGHSVPILAVTENDCRWSAQDYRDAGFNGMFLKPLEPTRLLAAIDDAMKNSRPSMLRMIETSRVIEQRAFGQARH